MLKKILRPPVKCPYPARTSACESCIKGKAVALVQKHPQTLSCVVEAKDPVGRGVMATPFQMAAMMGDYNIHPEQKKDYGMVEKLARLMAKDEVTTQIAQVFLIITHKS